MGNQRVGLFASAITILEISGLPFLFSKTTGLPPLAISLIAVVAYRVPNRHAVRDVVAR